MVIPKINFQEITPAQFLKEYFEPEKPVVLTGLTAPPLTNLQAFLESPEVEVNKTWYQSRESFLAAPPALVKEALAASFVREKNQRIWVNSTGHFTPFHSDVNELYVFNWHIFGRKRWWILSPRAAVTPYPFTQILPVSLNEKLPARLASQVTELELGPGEMLFLPPFWHHKVLSLGPENVNVNWVGTKKHGKNSPMAQRNRELLRLLAPFQRLRMIRGLTDTLLGSQQAGYLENYAGRGGQALVKGAIETIPRHRSVWRGLREMSGIPRLIRDWKKIQSYNRAVPERSADANTKA